MRSLFSFLFVAFLLWNYIGFFTYFQIEKYSAKKAFKQKIKKAVPESDLKIFLFSPKQIENLSWYEAHEFEYENVMYDIVSCDTTENGSIRYACVSDMQETILFAQLDQQIQRKVSDENQLPISNWKNVVSQPQFLPDISKIIWSKYFSILSKRCFHSFYEIRPGVTLLLTPPPEVHSFLA